jgi:hypothetical protein
MTEGTTQSDVKLQMPDEQRILLAEEQQMIDPRDPNYKSLIRFIPIIGPIWLTIALGFLFMAANGVIPILFFWIIGDLISSLGTASIDTIG